MNFKFVVLFALTLLAGSTVYGQDNVIDEVVWVVGDEAILKSEVEEARMSALYEGRKFDRDPYCVIPEEIAVQKLFLHQAALDSIEVSEAEVIQRVDYMTNMYITNIGSREKMEEYFNKTSSQIRETLRDNAREGLKVQKMQQKLVGEIKITPAEVRRYFKDLPQDSIPYIPTQVEVQIITQQPKVPLEEIENVKKRLRDFTDRITKGETSSLRWPVCIPKIVLRPFVVVRLNSPDVACWILPMLMSLSTCKIPTKYPKSWSLSMAFISSS